MFTWTKQELSLVKKKLDEGKVFNGNGNLKWLQK